MRKGKKKGENMGKEKTKESQVAKSNHECETRTTWNRGKESKAFDILCFFPVNCVGTK